MDVLEVALVISGLLGSGGVGAIAMKWLELRKVRAETAPAIIGQLSERVEELETKAEIKDRFIEELRELIRACKNEFEEATRCAREWERRHSALLEKHTELEHTCGVLESRLMLIEGKVTD